MSSAFLTSDYFIRPYEIVNLLTVVDRLIFGCPSTFFTKFVYEFHFQCRMPGIDQKVDYSTLN